MVSKTPGFGARDANHRPDGTVYPHHLDVGTVHLGKVSHIFQENVDVNDMVEIRIHGLQHDSK